MNPFHSVVTRSPRGRSTLLLAACAAMAMVALLLTPSLSVAAAEATQPQQAKATAAEKSPAIKKVRQAAPPAAKAKAAAGNPAGAPRAEKPTIGKWAPLFNGKDLKDWTIKIRGYDVGDNYKNTFRVEDGLLKVSYDGYDKYDFRFGHIFYNGTFSHYKLRITYRFVGEQCPGGEGWAFRNSGVMLHGQDPKSMGKDQKFPVSIEAQFLGGKGSGKRTTANLCTPGTNVVMNGKLFKPHCTGSRSKTYHGDQWVTVVLEVHGSKTIKHIIEGKTVLEYDQPQLDERDSDARKIIVKQKGEKLLERGTISLQSESHPVHFKTVEIMLLAE